VDLRPRGHHGEGGYYYPVYVPYTVPVIVEPVAPETEAVAADSEEPPAMTVFENRPTTLVRPPTQAPIDDSRVYHPGTTSAAPSDAAAPAESSQRPPIVLVYKDGHERDLQNYAIVGNFVYEISGYTSQKIAIADLNIPATVKANEERGVEFSLPSTSTP
jgi:hypothetical protein